MASSARPAEAGSPPVPPHPGTSSRAISQRMSRARRRDTRPEVELRMALHAMGLRYRVSYPILALRRRSIDIAFTHAKLAVFVDGCFWHGCPVHGTRPRSNRDWWEIKLATNARRDAETTALLETDGWRVLRIWEHVDPQDAASRVTAALEQLSMPRDVEP